MATRFCTQCGQPIMGDSKFCTNCGAPIPMANQNDPIYEPQPQSQPTSPRPTGPKPKSFLALSILATIFCCLPFGIPAIVFAAKVDNLWAAGLYAEAEEASRKAKVWTIVSIITGVVLGFAYSILVYMGSLASMSFFDKFY
jgi:hypothetical protein